MSNIFEHIESEKPVELNERIWQRVEDKLDVHKYKSKSNKYRWVAVAACLVVIVGVTFTLQPNKKKSSYQVTDFYIETNQHSIQETSKERSFLQKGYDKLVDCVVKRDKFSC